MKKLLGTTAAALALGVGAVLLGTAPASADQLPTVEDQKCDGTEVVTCIYPQIVNLGREVRARGSITDTANDGKAYQVAVTHVHLQVWDNGWQTLRSMEDLDGFKDNFDDSNTNTTICAPGAHYRAVAKFEWKKANGEIDWHWQWSDIDEAICRGA